MNQYIVILDLSLVCSDMIRDSHGFVQQYNDYQQAEEDGTKYIDAGDASEFYIVNICTEERNYLI